MYAIVEIAGQQFKVEKDQKVFVHRLSGNEGDNVSFDKVLLTGDNGSITVGAPAIEGASVGAEITRHLQGDKVIVFKKKRRKGYRKKNGHRQALTEILINDISINGKTTTKKTAKKKAETTEKKADDLKIIEGVGPKSEEALVAAGIDTFKKLAGETPEKIKEILSEASNTLAHLDPETWPKQAKLADEGKMDELKAWQDELIGGKEEE